MYIWGEYSYTGLVCKDSVLYLCFMVCKDSVLYLCFIQVLRQDHDRLMFWVQTHSLFALSWVFTTPSCSPRSFIIVSSVSPALVISPLHNLLVVVTRRLFVLCPVCD